MLGALLALNACARFEGAPPSSESSELSGPAPRLNSTPMAAALSCLQGHGFPPNLRVGVSDFVDGTGAMDGGTQNSRAFSQRPDMMMVVALSNAGAHLVNRSSVNVAEWEMGKAIEKKLGDGRSIVIDDQKVNYRPIKTGTILGSTHYITGAVTELNWNLDSKVAEGGAFGGYLGKRTYRISIAVDVVVTDTQTTEIVFAKSYKKQLVGFETNANFFRFVNRAQAVSLASLGTVSAASSAAQALEVFEANLGDKQNEPTQTALRWVVELSAYDVIRNLTRKGEACNRLLPPGSLDAYQSLVADAETEGVQKPAARPARSPAPRQGRFDPEEYYEPRETPARSRRPNVADLPDDDPPRRPATFSDLSAELGAAFAKAEATAGRFEPRPYGELPAPPPQPQQPQLQQPQPQPQPKQPARVPQAPRAAAAPVPAPEFRAPEIEDRTASIPRQPLPEAQPARPRETTNPPEPVQAQVQPQAPIAPPPQPAPRKDVFWLDGAVPALGAGFTKEDAGS